MQDPFKEYIKQVEPSKKERGYVWSTAIGLQDVDGIEVSAYMKETARRNIDGDISLDEARDLIDSYYIANPSLESSDRTEEADKVATRIAQVLSENAFSFTVREYLSIHKRLFLGIYPHAGEVRDYNISKKEWVLDEDTVHYGSAMDLIETLEYDISKEKEFSYVGLKIDEVIKHIARFIADLWQIHAFGEGNTRTTAVFLIKYLRTLGFEVTNDIFAEKAWFFRNALVRANYSDIKNGVYETTEYLELFLRNLLLDEQNQLRNRRLHIRYDNNTDFERKIENIQATLKTKENVRTMFDEYGVDKSFGRGAVMELLDLKQTRTSELLAWLLEENMIETMPGEGKGKYRFKL